MFDNQPFGNYQSAVPYVRPQAYMPQPTSCTLSNTNQKARITPGFSLLISNNL